MSFGFGSGFGAQSSPFNTTSPSPFGQSAPAFGQNTSPFGATTSTGVFGQQSQPAFGAAPAFGASAPAFGASAPSFGATSTPAFGSTSFGAKPATGGFGFGAASAASPFGATSTPAFGAASTPAFGAAPSPFGSTSTGFGQSAPAFGAPAASSTPAFGGAPSFGAPQPSPAFGAPAAGGFGAPAGGRGSRAAQWRKTQETDTSSTGTRSTVYYNSISCMPEYAGKSAEEIRWEDYQDNVKGGTGAASPGASGGLFGAPAAPAASPSPFGAPAASPSPFGATSTPAFGATSTPAFGAASTPAFGGFGAASSSPAFGAVSTPAFGFGSSPSPFGASTGAAPFGQSAPAFGATSSPAFGATSAPAFGGFGATSTPAFGAAPTSAPGFGATSAPAFGGFGATSTPAFGATSAPAFGAAPAASTPAFSFAGASSTPAFGGATSTPAFGAASSSSLFGAASTPAFGGGSSLFGGAAQKPASTPGFSFSSTPAFGATPSPAFGASSPGGLFGAASTPAFGATPGGGGLFGAAPASTPSFSFAPAGSTPTLGGGTLALAPFGGSAAGAAQPPSVGANPYGALPEAPKVTPLPEYKVGLTQRVLAPPSAGPPRPVALITPRSLTPHAGGKIRPRRGASASRMSRNPAEFLAAAAGVGGYGAAVSPAGTTPGSVSGTPGSSANLFVPRDNPRKLFIRDTLPSTEAAGGTSISPMSGGGLTPGRALRTPGSGLRITPGTRGKDSLTPNGGAHENGGGYHTAGGSGAFSRDRGLDDASIAALLPSLRRPDYYTEPSLTQLAAMARDDPESLREVANFTVGRRGVGSVRWLDPVDVTSLDLDNIVSLSRGSVEVYLDEEAKPEVGSGLNRPAEVTMLKVFKTDKETGKPTLDPEAVERFTRKLKKVAAEQGARFIMYDGGNGTWKFEVEHFSRYGLVGEDSDEEVEIQDGAGPSGVQAQKKQQSKQRSEDFGQGGGRTEGSEEEKDLMSNSDADDDDYAFVANLGVRRAGVKSAPGGQQAGKEAVVAGMEFEFVEKERENGEEMDDDEEEVVVLDEDENMDVAMQRQESKQQQQRKESLGGAAVGRTLQVSLPERLQMAPEELLRIRSGMYPSSSEIQPASKQRRIEVDLTDAVPTITEDLNLDLLESPEEAAFHLQPPSLTARNAWRRQARSPLRPPSDLPPSSAAAAEKSLYQQQQSRLPVAGVPALPSAPMPASPAGGAGTSTTTGAVLSSPCPVKTPAAASTGRERCLPDSGMALGASFKAGWGPNGVFAAHVAGGSAAQMAVKKVVIGSGVVSDASTVERRDVLRRRLKDLLRLHYQNSLPDPMTGSNRMAGAVPPRWKLRCSRKEGSLRDLTHRFIQLCNDQAAAMPGTEYSVDRTVLRHQAATWELVHALFSALPAEEGGVASTLPGDAMIEGDGQPGATRDGSAAGALVDGADTQQLEAMQRRAEVSRWLRDRSRSASERAANAASVSSGSSADSAAAARTLAMLSGHQLASAAAAAAISGDVRLATLIATAGSSSASKDQILAQLTVWRDAGFDSHIDQTRRQIYQLLSGQVDAVVPHLNLDWKRALGCQLWYGTSPVASVAEAVSAYEVAVESGTAPPPLPLYLEQMAAAQVNAAPAPAAQSTARRLLTEFGVLDIAFELLRLFCILVNSEFSDEMMQEQISDSLEETLARLLRPAGVTPDPLDYSFPWVLLCVLQAIKVVPLDLHSTAAAPAKALMAFIAQLENLGCMSHWAIYVALHMPDAELRDATVKELLARHCPEWEQDTEALSFLVESLEIPPPWIAEARALWAKYRKDDVAELKELIDAGDLVAAHDKLCESVAPAWLLASSSNAEAAANLEEVLIEMEGRAWEIDEAAGSGTWHRGGGLFYAYLNLQEIYLSLSKAKKSAATAGGGAGPSQAEQIVSYEERMNTCGELAIRLNEAAGSLAVAGTGGAKESSGNATLRSAAHSHIAAQLATWVMSDAGGDENTYPGPDHAALVASLRSLRYGKVAASLQMGAVALAGTLA